MQKSEQTADLFAALSKAQGEFPAIKRNKTAKMGSYSYDYADLGDMIEQLQPILKKNGLAVVSGPASAEFVGVEASLMVSVDTLLTHESGQWLESLTSLPCRSLDPQAVGSAITYARRYGYGAILGVAADTDDDGQSAMKDDKPREMKVPDDITQWVFPIDEKRGYKGKPVTDVPVEYLRDFILGDKFDKKDIRDATTAFLSTIATPDEERFFFFMAEQSEEKLGKDVVDAEKTKALVEKTRYKGGGLDHEWYAGALKKLTSHWKKEQLEKLKGEFLSQEAQQQLAAERDDQEAAPDAPVDGDDIPF